MIECIIVPLLLGDRTPRLASLENHVPEVLHVRGLARAAEAYAYDSYGHGIMAMEGEIDLGRCCHL